MKGYTKLHAKIVMSSIWRAPDHVRILWITMLALADEDGVVQASVGGLADMARLPVSEAKDALVALMSPDPDSSDGTTGERIEPCPGGWLVLNHANYREKQTRQQALAAARVRRHRERKRQEQEPTVTPNEGNAVKRLSASASASASVPQKKGVPELVAPDGVSDELLAEWVAHRKSLKAVVTQRVLDGMVKKGASVGLGAAQALEDYMEAGHQGYYPDRSSRGRTGRLTRGQQIDQTLAQPASEEDWLDDGSGDWKRQQEGA